mgnify:CR=1 FL=1
MKDIYMVTYNHTGLDGETYQEATYCDKEYWDKYKAIDDAPEQELIDAFEELGLEEVMTGTLQWCDDISIDELTNKMKQKGYNLIIDDDDFIEDYCTTFKWDPADSEGE